VINILVNQDKNKLLNIHQVLNRKIIKFYFVTSSGRVQEGAAPPEIDFALPKKSFYMFIYLILVAMLLQLDDDKKEQHIEVMEVRIVLIYLEFLR
jgi:hypothetical protein